MERDVRTGLTVVPQCRPRSTSTTTAAAGSSTTSPACPSTTRPARSGPSWRPMPGTWPDGPGPTPWWSWGGHLRQVPGPARRPAGGGHPGAVVPLDVSDTTLWNAATALAEEYPDVVISAVVADFHHHLDRLPRWCAPVRLPGGTIGNLDPGQRRRFLADLDCVMDHGDRLLLGTDLVKERGRLVRAYDDSAGVTAEFNRNVLLVLNRELGAASTPGGSSTWPCGTRPTRGSRCGCGPRRPVGAHRRPRPRRRVRRGRGAAHRDQLEVHPRGPGRELSRCGFVVEATWRSPGDEFQMTLAAPYC